MSLSTSTSHSLGQCAGCSPAATKEPTTVSFIITSDPQTDGDADADADAESSECFSETDKRFWWLVSGASGVLAMAAGSFGAHGLQALVTDVYYLDVWKTAAHYHLTHSIVLGLAPVVVAALRRQRARSGQNFVQQLGHTLGLGGTRARARTKAANGKAPAEVRLRPYRNWSATLIATGTALFCGSLYGLVLTEQGRPWGLIAPIGAIAIPLGWVCMGVGL